MDHEEWINKIVHGLTSITELSKANRHLAYSLKKELKKNEDFEKNINRVKNELVITKSYMKHYERATRDELIQSLNDEIRMLNAEKNVLLRKLNIEQKE